MNWDALRMIHLWLPESSDGWHQHPNGGGWVQDTATVANTVLVGEHALVYGEARVYGEALVCGKALVCGEARVSDEALVCGALSRSPLSVSGLLPWMINDAGSGLLGIGCECHRLSEWREQLPEIAKRHHAEEFVPVIRDVVLPLFDRWFAEHPDAIVVGHS